MAIVPYADYIARLTLGENNSTNFYKNLMQNIANDKFDSASDVYTIQLQNRLTLVYEDIIVRVTKAIKTKDVQFTYTEDDYKEIIFQNLDQDIRLGDMFSFQNYYWMVINTDNIYSITASCTIRKCNNVLKCILPNGYNLSIPCVISEVSKRSMTVEKDGTMMESQKMPYLVNCQKNIFTNVIPVSYRVLFGKLAYKITDINDITLPNIITFLVTANQNRPTDNFITGYADNQELEILQPSGALIVLGSSKLTTGITLNYSIAYDDGTIPTGMNFTWTLSNNTNATLTVIDGLNCSLKGLASSQVKLTATSTTGSSIFKIVSIGTSF